MTNTHNQLHINIYEGGELVNEQYEPQTTPLDVVRQGIGNICSSIALQAEMGVYDVLHGTKYRAIRNELTRQERNRAFEAKIGLVACSPQQPAKKSK
jgi:hypothetical protein